MSGPDTFRLQGPGLLPWFYKQRGNVTGFLLTHRRAPVSCFSPGAVGGSVQGRRGSCQKGPLNSTGGDLVGALFLTPPGCGFHSQTGHIPKLRVRAPVGGQGSHRRQLICVSLSHQPFSRSHSVPPSLPPSSLSEIN